MNKYSMSAFKYDDDTGRPIPLEYYKADDLLTHARHTAKLMLETEREAVFIRIYEGHKHIEDVTRN